MSGFTGPMFDEADNVMIDRKETAMLLSASVSTAGSAQTSPRWR